MPDVVVDCGVAAEATVAGTVPVVKLRAAPGATGANDDSVYRYDRAGLLAALGGRIGAGRQAR